MTVEVAAILRGTKLSAQKARLVADQVRGKPVEAALDILTIKMIQEIIVNLQQESHITICICDHQARDLLACVDVAMILSNCKIVAHGSPSDLIKDTNAQNAYFGNSFKIS